MNSSSVTLLLLSVSISWNTFYASIRLLSLTSMFFVLLSVVADTDFVMLHVKEERKPDSST